MSPLDDEAGCDYVSLNIQFRKGKFILKQVCPVLQNIQVHNRKRGNMPIHFATTFVKAEQDCLSSAHILLAEARLSDASAS
jgi:hypothetical protein